MSDKNTMFKEELENGFTVVYYRETVEVRGMMKREVRKWP